MGHRIDHYKDSYKQPVSWKGSLVWFRGSVVFLPFELTSSYVIWRCSVFDCMGFQAFVKINKWFQRISPPSNPPKKISGKKKTDLSFHRPNRSCFKKIIFASQKTREPLMFSRHLGRGGEGIFCGVFLRSRYRQIPNTSSFLKLKFLKVWKDKQKQLPFDFNSFSFYALFVWTFFFWGGRNLYNEFSWKHNRWTFPKVRRREKQAMLQSSVAMQNVRNPRGR